PAPPRPGQRPPAGVGLGHGRDRRGLKVCDRAADLMNMADLSNLLGAVYGEEGAPERDPDGPPTPVEKAADERTPAVPHWADDDHLDAAFAEWKPGPTEDAHPAEKAFVTDESVIARPL